MRKSATSRKSIRALRVVRLLCHGSLRPVISWNTLTRRHAAPGGNVMMARCIRPATTCSSCSVRVGRDANAPSISTYCMSLRSSSSRVKVRESHQKPM